MSEQAFVDSPLVSLLPSREKVSAKPTDEGAHRLVVGLW
jgi:hypothetical protein